MIEFLRKYTESVKLLILICGVIAAQFTEQKVIIVAVTILIGYIVGHSLKKPHKDSIRDKSIDKH
jgi:hypothetical protein